MEFYRDYLWLTKNEWKNIKQELLNPSLLKLFTAPTLSIIHGLRKTYRRI